MALNRVEQVMLNTLVLLRDYLTNTRKVEKWEYVNIMTEIRDAIKAGECKRDGCPSGKHTSPQSVWCKCTEEKQHG